MPLGIQIQVHILGKIGTEVRVEICIKQLHFSPPASACDGTTCPPKQEVQNVNQQLFMSQSVFPLSLS